MDMGSQRVAADFPRMQARHGLRSRAVGCLDLVSRSSEPTQATPGPLLGLLSPWTLTAMIAGVIAFYASARSLQIGEGVEVIALLRGRQPRRDHRRHPRLP